MFEQLLEKAGIDWHNEQIAALPTERLQFKKGSLLTAQGAVENYIYFLEEGSVKFSHWVDIKEYILDFWFEGDFFTSFASLIERAPSPSQCQAMTDVTVQRIHYDQLQQVYRDSHLGSEIGRRMAERMYVHKTRKEIELLSLTAEQRYEKLLDQSKRLILEIPVKDVASYLGILPESLSRIRRKLIS